MENKITFVDLITSGAQYGGLRRECHPKMVPFVHEVKRGHCIINLKATEQKINKMVDKFYQIGVQKQKVLFVATKSNLRKVLRDIVGPTDHYYVNYRWLGGLLTNFEVLYRRIERLQKVRQEEESKAIENLTKREQMMFRKEKYRLERTLRGIAEMQKLPDYLVLISPHDELTALAEGEKLGIPVFGLTRTGINPEHFSEFIPFNDNSERSVSLILQTLMNALLAGEKGETLTTSKNKTALKNNLSTPDQNAPLLKSKGILVSN